MGVSQIGNGDFPLNNCAILRQILPETSLDFMKTVLRGEAFANPIANLAGDVRAKIGNALTKIGTLEGVDGGGFFTEMKLLLGGDDGTGGFLGQLIEFESRTNRMSGVITGFQEGQPDMGRILGIGSAYNSALATLVTDPEELLKDNFSHGFNSLKQEFGVNAIQESNTALEAAGNFLAQFGLGTPDNPLGSAFVDPPPYQFYNEAQQILGDIRSIQQSITNIITAEDAFLAGALAFLDQYALANTALSGVLTDPCMAGKIIGIVASGDLESLIPDLQLPSVPSIDDILDKVPDPEDIANSIKESVEGIVESVQEQVQQTIEQTVEIGKETVEAIQKTAEEIVEAGEQLVEQAEQAAQDLAENVEDFGRDVDKFFENLEKQVEEATTEETATETTTTAQEAEVNYDFVEANELWLMGIENRSGPTSIDLLRGVPLDRLESALASANPNSAFAGDLRTVIAEKQG
jgi:polyhydroxyalkanoate synthesis regulator phasin